ncbi:MAG TPA: cupin domain-containing protein [Thermomicrobiales bacterium]|nr:cupin domain-containing protein [Thermomicrobiales bacterium]
MVHTGQEIVNPRTGQRMIFRQTARDTNGALLQIETVNPPHGSAEPEHVHVRQESSAEVLAGALHFRVRGEVRVVRAGEKIVIPPNTPHNFWNEGEEEARAIQEFRPALRTEDFFETLFGLARDGKLDEKGMPSLLQLAVMVPAFGEEIRPTSPPWPLLRAITWFLGPIARLRGYRSVYPQPGRKAPGASTP